MREYTLLLCSWLVILIGHAQPSAALDDPFANFEDARLQFESDAFGLASYRFSTFNSEPILAGSSQLYDKKLLAELNQALAAHRAGLTEAGVLLERFIDRYSPQPIAIDAIKQVADIAFAERDYKRAAAYYERLPLSGLDREKRDEVRFRLGYTAFASKDFRLAARYLGDLRANQGLYQEPATYYYALTRFYTGDNAGAKAAFESLANSETYRSVITGNLAQIYFSDGEFEKLIRFASPLVDQPGVRQRGQIHLLIGRSYFELQRYEEALPHLEFYAQGSKKMSAADFYQLGFTQYQTNNFEPAALNLKQLANEDSDLGQAAMYYLGNAYLQLDNRTDARPAFSQVLRMDFDPVLREEAAWNVAKLSYELGYDQDALTGLQAISKDSRHYSDAQVLLSRVILNSRDYTRALDVLNELPSLTPALKETRQQVRVLRGLQLFQERKYDDSEHLLSRSLEEASDPYYKAIANFWLGDIAYKRNELSRAAQRLNSFLTTAKTTSTALPPDANAGTANYLLGYVFLKQQEYGVALGHFQEAIVELRKRLRLTGANRALSTMLGDAVVRAGDAYFKRNDYPSASKFYDEAIDNQYPGFVYSLYQKSIIEGLRGDNTEKIINLETIADEHPKSAFADEALFELGITYQSINQLKRSNQALERLLTEKPNSPLKNEALLQLGLVSINQGNTETAINYYKQVFANNPKAGEVRRAQDALQEIYVDDLGRPDDYFAFLETVPGFKLDARVRDSINYVSALNQYQTGNYDRAVDQFGKYLQEFPKGGYALEARYKRADAYLLLEQYPEALKEFEAIIQKGENKYYVESLLKGAEIAYNAEKDFEKAYRYFNRIIELGGEKSTDPELRLQALRAAYRSENTEAVYALAEPIITNPDLAESEKAVAGFYLGKVAYDRKDFDRALASFNAVIRNTDGEAAAESRYLIGRIYFLRREIDLTEQIAKAAQAQSSAYPYWVVKSTLLLVDVFLEKEDYLGARAVAESIVDHYDGDEQLEQEALSKLNEVKAAQAASSQVAPLDTNTIDLVEPETGN